MTQRKFFADPTRWRTASVTVLAGCWFARFGSRQAPVAGKHFEGLKGSADRAEWTTVSTALAGRAQAALPAVEITAQTVPSGSIYTLSAPAALGTLTARLRRRARDFWKIRIIFSSRELGLPERRGGAIT